MSKIVMFSQVFPKYHPKTGEPTHFKEKFWCSIKHSANYYDLIMLNPGKEKEAAEVWNTVKHNWRSIQPKHHTIREGHRFKVGDLITPKVWGYDINPTSGRTGPYQSKQIVIAPDIEVKKTFDFEFIPALWIDESSVKINGQIINAGTFEKLAMNDGLTVDELINWFGNGYMFSSKLKPFTGQIICWNETINY